LLSSSLSSNLNWDSIIDGGYLITCPNGDPGGERLKRSNKILTNVGLSDKIEVREFETDDEDRIRGCYNSHIEVYKEVQREMQGREDYSVLVIEDNVR